MTKKMTNLELCDRASSVAMLKTVYAYGGLGYHGTTEQKARVLRAYPKENNKTTIRNADEDTWMFDCVGFVKAILNGFMAQKKKPNGTDYNYGGANFPTSGPLSAKYGAASFFNEYCEGISKDFTNILPGEAVWLKGDISTGGDSHIGIYLGNSLVVECTPRWGDGVQITSCLNIANIVGYNARLWDYHAKIPCVDYCEKVEVDTKQYHTATKGQGLYKISKIYGITLKEIKALNPEVKAPLYKVNLGQKIRVK